MQEIYTPRIGIQTAVTLSCTLPVKLCGRGRGGWIFSTYMVHLLNSGQQWTEASVVPTSKEQCPAKRDQLHSRSNYLSPGRFYLGFCTRLNFLAGGDLSGRQSWWRNLGHDERELAQSDYKLVMALIGITVRVAFMTRRKNVVGGESPT
jgi:hypothetical protein